METSIKLRLIYNPYILHLLFVKLRYLFNILNRYYRRKEEVFPALLDYCVLHNHYADLLVEELIAFEERMREQSSPIELIQCHFEVYLYRITQFFRGPLDPVDSLFECAYYSCETKIASILTRDIHRIRVQTLVAQHIEAYYIHYSPKAIEQRITLFFNLKNMLERWVDQNRLDKEDNARYYIQYDNELTVTLFYMYFFSEMYCLNELNEHCHLNAELLLDECIGKQVTLFTETAQKKENIVRPEVMDLSYAELLQKAFCAAYDTYCDLFLKRIVFYTKEDKTGNNSIFTSFFSTDINTTSQYNNARKESHLAYLAIINREYKLSGPLQPVISPVHIRSDGTLKKLGRTEFYNTREDDRVMCVPLTYPSLKDNPCLYTLCLYRLAFEIEIDEAHTKCRGEKECYLCAYGKRENEHNVKLKQFIKVCQAYDLENINKDHYAKYQHLCEDLDKLHIDLIPSLPLRHYKTIVSVCWLFQYMPLKLKGETKYHNLFHMINPLALITSLSRQILMAKLDKAMWDLLCATYQKLRLEQENKMIEAEQSLAMECEIVRLLSEEINMQCNDIQRYERSLSTYVVIEATELCREVAGALKRIYLGYLNALIKIIDERHQQVNLDI